ncbi:MAG: hypothetical protein ACFFD2_26855 [Promethearchaeota archaeon]
MNAIINVLDDLKRPRKVSFANVIMTPIIEEGLLIGIAIVAILIILGIIFGVFDWISESFSSLFDQF